MMSAFVSSGFSDCSRLIVFVLAASSETRVASLAVPCGTNWSKVQKEDIPEEEKEWFFLYESVKLLTETAYEKLQSHAF